MRGLRYHIKLLVAALICAVGMAVPLTAFGANSAVDPSVLNFRRKLDDLLSHSCFKNKNYGVAFYSLDRGEMLYQANSHRRLIPASNMKMFTTAMALRELGPDFRFITQLFTRGKVSGDVLKGDLFIKGYGDPKLVSEQMWLLVNEVRNLPLRRVKGDIVADDTYFDGRRRIKSWRKNPGPEPYNAPIGALSLNFNTVTVYAGPGPRPGDKPTVTIDPGSEYIRVNNGATTLPSRFRSQLVVDRVDRKGYDEITVSGGIPLTGTVNRYYLNITEPTNYTARVFKEFLQREGIRVTGKVRRGKVPQNARLLLTHRSEPLSEILKGLNKYSNNFTAEQILKIIGAKRYGPPGTTEKGLKVMQEFMAAMGFPPGDYLIVDGSGLSRHNRVTVRQIIRLLKFAHSDWSLYPEFISSLAVMGTDGSVKDRLAGYPEAQKARVKTGTLNFTSAISGYLQSKDGERFAFSILMNDLKCFNARVVRIQDRIIQEGLEFRRGQGN